MTAESAHLQAALEKQIAAGAPGALALIEAPAAGLDWAGAAGQLAQGDARSLRPGDAFRIASVTKSITAAVAVSLAQEDRLVLDDPLGDQLSSELLERWRALESLPRTTPRQLLAHTSGLANYFGDEEFFVQVRREPRRAWHPVEFVDYVATHATSHFPPGEGFQYSDTGYTVAGILIEVFERKGRRPFAGQLRRCVSGAINELGDLLYPLRRSESEK